MKNTANPSATTPMARRSQERLERSTATSRSAAIGRMRVALIAGTTAASVVTTTPTRKAMPMVKGRMTRLAEGSSTPKPSSSAVTP